MAEQLKLDLEGRRPRRPPSREAEGPPRVDTLETAKARARWIVAQLSVALGTPVRLVVTDNRRIMISTRRDGVTTIVRVHHMFLRADDATIVALGRYIAGGDRKASGVLDAFIAGHDGTLRNSRRSVPLRPVGNHHDLAVILGELAAEHFGGAVDARITWGRSARRRKQKRSIQLGTYLADEQLIRVHPVLDQDWVPRFYVETVVFHELLHHDMPCVVHNGRRRFHTKEFRARERAFPHYDLAEQWEKAHLPRLLRGG